MKMFDEKKEYLVVMKEDALYSVGIMALIGTLSRENRLLYSVEMCNHEAYIVWSLNLNKKQKIALEETAKDYITHFSLREENIRQVVWK